MDWQQFVMNLEALDPAAIEVIFLRNGACSVTLSDAGDDPVLEPGLGETPLWADTRITGLFPQTCDLRQLESDLLSELGLTSPATASYRTPRGPCLGARVAEGLRANAFW